jgi:hypothetical protein
MDHGISDVWLERLCLDGWWIFWHVVIKGPAKMISILVWNAIPSFLMWCVWRERNTQCFDDQERTSSNLRTCVLKSLFEWISAIAFLHVSSFTDFCSLFSCS